MKELLKLGNAVDDGTGDYLREGGGKLNNNFDDLYGQLGDGVNPHAAGAFKTISVQANGNVVNAEFGHAYSVDTSAARMTINLPKGSVARYNTVIKIRDTFGTWQTNPVTITPAIGDTLKGEPNSKEFSTNLTDLELVYCAPGRWEYVPNKLLNKISSSDVATVAKKEYIATAGQTDFPNVFDGTTYNLSNTQVYHRGNLLFYGNSFTNESDYGSIGPNDSLVELDGVSIKLRHPCEEGDAIIIVTYMDGIAQWRSTYNRLDATVLDSNSTNEVQLAGSRIVADLSTLNTITLEQLGYVQSSNTGLVNPGTLEVYVNGVFLNEAGTAGLPMFICDGADANNQEDCTLQGGLWNESNTDYSVIENDTTGAIEALKFDRTFEHGDIISVKWFNNDIGTTLTADEILEITDPRYISRGQELVLTGCVRVTDYNNPRWPNVELIPETRVDVSSPAAMFDLLYPIGHVIENGLNPNNPATYMGFGSWVLFAKSKTTIGWSDDPNDTKFHLNNNDIDANGNPSATAGGTGGAREITLENDHMPATKTDEKVLIADANGTIVVGGCQFDPDEQGPAYDKYREAQATTNATHIPPKSIEILSPYETVYRWMRIA